MPAAPTGAYRRYALVYDLVWRAAPYDRFVDLCLEAAAAQGTSVRRVLVAACGTGSAAVELARRGLRGHRLRPVPGDGGRGRGEAPGRRTAGGPPAIGPGWWSATSAAVPLGDGWADLVLVLNASLNYLLEPAEVVAALAHMGRVAAPGGTVVVEPLSRRFVHEGWEPGRHVDRDGLRLDASYEVEGDLVVERLRWTLGGVEESETYRQRLYADAELEALLGRGRPRAWSSGGRCGRPSRPSRPAGRTLWVARPAG